MSPRETYRLSLSQKHQKNGGGRETFILIFQQVWWLPSGQGQARMSMHECGGHSFSKQTLTELPLHATPYAEYGGYGSGHSGHGP